MHAFAYCRPAALADALRELAADAEARPLAGGQTLLPVMRARLAAPSRLVDLARVRELTGIAAAPGGLRLGAMETHAAIAEHPAVKRLAPALARLAGGIGDPQVRNRGTIGGSLANNDPAACYPAALLALGAAIETDRRTLAAEDFFTGLFATALAPGELVVAVQVPAAPAAAYVKFPQPASRFALVGAFVLRTEAGYRVAITGGGMGVFRWTEAEAALDSGATGADLAGVPLDPELFTGDLHASARYRRALARVAVARALADPAFAA